MSSSKPLSFRQCIVLGLILSVLIFSRVVRILPDLNWDVMPVPTDWRKLSGDAHTYDMPARNLVNGLGYSNALEPPYTPGLERTPAYPLLLAGIYSVAGRRGGAVRLMNALLDLAAAMLLLSIARRYVGNGWALALLAAVALVAPWSAFLGRRLSEPLATFLLLLSLRLCTDVRDSALRWLAIGLSLGALLLCRPIFALLPFAIAAWAISPWRSLRMPRALIVAWLAAGVAVVWGPWILRNAVATGRFVPLSCGGFGLSLWFTTWSDWQETGSVERLPDGTVVRRLPAHAFENEVQSIELTAALDRYIEAYFRNGDIGLCDADKPFAAVAIRRITAAPYHWLGGQIVRMLRMLQQPFYFEIWLNSGFLSSLVAAQFGLCIMAGLILALREHGLQPAAVFFLYTWVIHFPTHAEPRYLSPAYGAGMLLGFVAISWLASRMFRFFERKPTPS